MVRQRLLAVPMVRMEPKLLILFFTFNENNRGHFHNQTDSEISKFVICNYAYPTHCRIALPRPPDMTFSVDNSDSDEGHGQQEGKNSDCYLTFRASCTPSELHLLTQEDLKDPVRDFIMSRKTNSTRSFQTTRLESPTPRY
jgi:hypothetical protein